MPRANQQIASFLKGEVTPAVQGQTDVEEYPQFLDTAENVFVEKHGGIKRRGGMKYVNEALDPQLKVRLVPFIFSRTDSYVMEFGDRYMRLFQDGGYVEDIGSVQTYLGDGTTTHFQFPYGLVQEPFAGDGAQTVFTYTFDTTPGGTFAVWLWTSGAGWAKQVETTDYTHNSGAKTVTMVVPPPLDSVLMVADASINENDIEVFVTVDGEIGTPESPANYTIEPINTLDNIVSPFHSANWNPDAGSTGNPWIIDDALTTATSPDDGQPILRETNINLTHGATVTFQVDITNISYAETTKTESNTVNIPLVSGDPYIQIEVIDITEEGRGITSVSAQFAAEDTSGAQTSDFFWEIWHNQTLITNAEGVETAVGIPLTITTPTFDISNINLEVGDTLSLQVRAVENNPNSLPRVSGSVTASSITGTGLLDPNAKLHVASRDSGSGSGARDLALESITPPYTWVISEDNTINDPQPLLIEFYTDLGVSVKLDNVYVRNSRSGWDVIFNTAPPLGEVVLIRDSSATNSTGIIRKDINNPDTGIPFEVQTPFTRDELDDLYWAQANDIMWFCHKNHRPWKLTRKSEYEWLWSQPTLYGAPWDIPATSWQSDGTSVDYEFYFSVNTKSQMEIYFNDELVDPADWDLKIGQTFPVSNHGTVTFETAPPLGVTILIAHTVSDYNPIDGYPACVVFFQERLWFAATVALPQSLWGSRAADFEDFAVKGNKQVLQPDDAVEYTIAAYTHETIEWLSSERVLVIGTSATEHRLAPDEYVATDRLPRVSKMTDFGGGHQMPMYMGGLTCFVQQSGRQLRSFEQRSNMVLEEYESIELTWMASHMVKENWIKEPYYALVPHNIAVMVREDGQLLTAMYDPSTGQMDAKDSAWSRQVTDGTFESVCVIPTDFGHQVWAAVRRVVDGVNKLYIEYITDDFFMDSAMYTTAGAPPTDTLTNLDHLEGKTVDILVDGAVHPQKVVENGTVILDWPGSDVVVGLHYRPKIKTVPFTDGIPTTGQGKPGRWAEIWTSLVESGYPLINGKRPPVRHPSTPMGDPEDYYVTGAVRVFNSGYDFDKQITVEQDLPIPFHITSLYGTFIIGGG